MTKKKKRMDMSPVRARRSVRDHLDFDEKYLASLSEAELDWLNKFCREYYHGRFEKNGPNIHPDDKRRDCYAGNNARNRDMWNRFDRLDNDLGSHENWDSEEDDK